MTKFVGVLIYFFDTNSAGFLIMLSLELLHALLISRMCENMAHYQISADLRQIEEVERSSAFFSGYTEAQHLVMNVTYLWSKVQFLLVQNCFMYKIKY